MSSPQEKVVELKRRAIALKESGDVNGAMVLLAEARDIEFENSNIDDLWHPLKLKQFAVVLKKKGDLEGARQALIKAKQIETEGLASAQAQAQAPTEKEPPAPTNNSATETETETAPPTTAIESQPETNSEGPSKANDEDDENKPSSQQEIDSNKDDKADDDDKDDDDGDDDDKDELKELMELDQDDGDDDAPMKVSYTIEDMTDQEMMTEFRLGGMPVPSQDEYKARILECKKAALASKKAGDTARAMQELQKSKKLEQVRIALSHMNEGLGLRINDDDDGWIETLNDEESELLGEFLNKKPNGDSNGSGGTGSNNLEQVLEDLSGFMEDPALLLDAINMGMVVPSVADVETQIQEQKRIAMEHKQAGDLERAKAALIQSKKFAAYAAKLEIIQTQMEQLQQRQDDTSMDIPIEHLEALVEEADGIVKAKTPLVNANKKEVPKGPAVKSSKELREEAVRLRDEKNIVEAAKVLKLYKEALKREEEAAELMRLQEAIQELQKEIDYAKEQIHVFEFYQRFVDTETQQIAGWNEYMSNCAKVAKVIKAKGLESIKMSRKAGSLMCVKPLEEHRDDVDFNAMVTDLVEFGSNSDPTDERLEITLLNVQDVLENAHVKKALREQIRDKIRPFPTTIRVEVTVQFPPNEHETEKATECVFQSSTRNDPNDGVGTDHLSPSRYEFEAPQYVDLPRGNSAYGKIVRKRIERNRKIQISVFQIAIPPPKKGGGWFFSSKQPKADDLPPPTLLGKVVLELQSLLTKKCVAAGEFPLMNGSGSKALGGTIQLGVRTGMPYGSSEQGQDTVMEVAPTSRTELKAYEAVSFSLGQPATAAEV